MDAQATPTRSGITFYLGTHIPSWLESLDVPLCVARRHFEGRRKMPRARGRFMLDSGGFTELQRFGEWTVKPADYVTLVRRVHDEVGGLDWAAPQDWMCEAVVRKGGVLNGQRFVGTGLTVAEHLERTADNFIELRSLAPDLPFRLVLQGDHPDDYLWHADMYERRGISLAAEPLICVGSVCRLQRTAKAAWIMSSLWPLPLHGFGVKTTGLLRYGHKLASADSLAWSFGARREPRSDGCIHPGNCANCVRRALWWRDRILGQLAAADQRGVQDGLFDGWAGP